MARKEAKRWVFTDNTTQALERRSVQQWEIWNSVGEFEQNIGKSKNTRTKKINEILGFIIVGMETAPDTGTTHGQGYVEFQKKRRMTAVKSILGLPSVHLEVARGSAEENIAYCCKDKEEQAIYQWGKPAKGQGHRADLEKTVELIKSGAKPIDIADQCPIVYMKFHSGIDKMVAMQLLKSIPLVRPVKVWLLWGPTDTGKTHAAIFTNIAKEQVYVKHACDIKKGWWQGYQGQKRVVIDEFYNGCAHITTFLKLLDKYRKELDIKNSMGYSQWEEVIITTNLHYPEEIYSGASEAHRRALFRRIEKSGGGVLNYTVEWGKAGWVNLLAQAQDIQREEDDEKMEVLEDVEEEPNQPNIIRNDGFVFDTNYE